MQYRVFECSIECSQDGEKEEGLKEWWRYWFAGGFMVDDSSMMAGNVNWVF